MRNQHFLLSLLLPLLSTLLFWLAWPPMAAVICLFVAIVPLLFIHQFYKKQQLSAMKFLLLVYCTLVLWHLVTTYWLYNTTVTGTILIHLLNPILLTIPWWVFLIFDNRFGSHVGYMALVSSWLSIEYLHHNWQLAFPYLTLGNGLSKYPILIQFYEYTGVLGGSLWVLVVNIAIFQLLRKLLNGGYVVYGPKALIGPMAIVFVPLLLSGIIYYSYDEKGRDVEVLVVHPNTDCRYEKYEVSSDQLIDKYLGLTFNKLSQNTDYILWPETAVTDAGWIEDMSSNPLFTKLLDTLKDYPKAKLVTGAVLYERSIDNGMAENAHDIRFADHLDMWYYTYNASFQLNPAQNTLDFRTKDKLVPMEETIPYAREFSLISSIVPSLGGYLFASRPEYSKVFNSGDGKGVASMICYESLFGSFIAKHVNKGANLIFISLNEGWYKHLTGASQFLHYASVRAIENRRSVARSSNDGISAFINQKGEILNRFGSFKPASIIQSIKANRKKTFYTVFGDYIGVIAIAVSLLLLIRLAVSKLFVRN
ncbi:MAG: apolipoprotein N-acyltransferase [Bacteroidota bacterium]